MTLLYETDLVISIANNNGEYLLKFVFIRGPGKTNYKFGPPSNENYKKTGNIKTKM
jgi:hypothetical protein